MAKVAFSKLGTAKETGVTEIVHNEQKIEVKKYLPVSEKLELISNVINQSYDSKNNFANPVQVSVFAAINIIEKYTNITFTEKQKEDPAALYDKLMGSDLYTEIYIAIPKEETSFLTNAMWNTIDAFYKYKSSALGIMENITQDYSNLELDASKIQKMIGNKENVEWLNEVLNKMG